MKKAVIFDMDGVIVFSETVYQKRRDEFFSQHGIELTEEIQASLFGSNVRDMFAKLIPTDEQRRYTLMHAYEQFRLDYPIDYRQLLNPDLLTTVKELRKKGIRLAIASSSSLTIIRKILAINQLTDFFELLVSGEQFARSKPDPEIYYFTVEQLGLSAEDCLVVEDSTIGVTAALRANLEVAALNNPCAQATYTIQTVREVLQLIE